MGNPREIMQFSGHYLQIPLGFANYIPMLFFSCVVFLFKTFCKLSDRISATGNYFCRQSSNLDPAASSAPQSQEHRRPSPPPVIAASIKQKLPVMAYSCFVERTVRSPIGTEESPAAAASLCIVCLNRVTGGDEVRELYNCRHVFHSDCLDAWIDREQVTCPLCRSKLLPDVLHDYSDEKDMKL